MFRCGSYGERDAGSSCQLVRLVTERSVQQLDVIVVGAGMAGASLAFELSAGASVLLLEREEQPGYHSTGRSAAAFIPSYGHTNPALFGLTQASRSFLETPQAGFSDEALLRQRGLLTVASLDSGDALQKEFMQVREIVADAELLAPAAALAKVSALRPNFANQALFEPEVFDIDVHALHQAYLRGFRLRGGVLSCSIQITDVAYRGGQFVVETNQEAVTAPLLVNASGAWADVLAVQAGVAPVGLQPLRRTAVRIDPPEHAKVDDWPLLLAQDGSFYAKPDAGALMVSPADEHPSAPTDAQPEELDIAYAVHHVQQALAIEQPKVLHAWAGLRSFVADRTPVIGFDPDHAGFFWLCGQGGHGIQTAPACAKLASSLLLDHAVPACFDGTDFSADWVSPARLREL